jgi:hypothetical protein
MLNREYFEQVIGEQHRRIGRGVFVTLREYSGRELNVWTVVEAHDSYVILEVHSGGDEPERNTRWQNEHPDEPPWVFDQVAVSYESIASILMSPQKGQAKQVGARPIGFQNAR